MEVYLFTLIGCLLVLISGCASLNKATPNLTLGQVISEYVRLNGWNIILGVMSALIVVYLSASNQVQVLQTFGINPEISSSGMICGLLNQFLASRIIGLIPSVNTPIIDTSGEKVMTKG